MSDGTPGDEMSATRQPGDSLTVRRAAMLAPLLALWLSGDQALWLGHRGRLGHRGAGGRSAGTAAGGRPARAGLAGGAGGGGAALS